MYIVYQDMAPLLSAMPKKTPRALFVFEKEKHGVSHTSYEKITCISIEMG